MLTGGSAPGIALPAQPRGYQNLSLHRSRVGRRVKQLCYGLRWPHTTLMVARSDHRRLHTHKISRDVAQDSREQLDIWTLATIQQGEALLEITREWSRDQQRPTIDQSDTVLSFFRAHRSASHLYVLSIFQCRIALNFVEQTCVAESRNPINYAISELDRVVPALRDVRNAVVHFDDYIQGQGRLQKGAIMPGLHFSIMTQFDVTSPDASICFSVGRDSQGDILYEIPVVASLEALVLCVNTTLDILEQ